MQTIHFRQWTFRCDPDETRRIYALLAQRLSERGGMACSCPRCRNFFQARDRERVFPGEVLSLFESLGIDYKCETELLSLRPHSSGAHSYSVWFPFVADRLERPRNVYKPDSSENSESLEMDFDERIDDSCSISFTDQVMFVPDLFGRRPSLEAVVTLKVPWILAESDPGG